MMSRLLVAIGLWLARLGGWTPMPACARPHAPDSLIVQTARRLVAWAEEAFPDTGGEHKRHQVYARMLKEHPGFPKRAIALAIELALL